MAIADPNFSLFVPVRLVANPTNLGGAFPHGGIEIGPIRDGRFAQGGQTRERTAEEFGGEVVEDFIAGRDSILFACVLDGIKDAGLAKIWPRGSPKYPDSLTPGYRGTAFGFKLLVAPRDTTNHPGVILYNAYPLEDETNEMRFGIEEEFGYPVMFRGVRDGTNRVFDVDLLSALSL